MFRLALDRRTFIASLLALLGCQKPQGIRGDFAQFFMTEVKERGGRLQTTSRVAPIEARWTIEHDEFGFQIHLFNAEITQVNTFMDQALGKPLLAATTNLDGDLHTVYDPRFSGFHVQVIGEKSKIQIVAVGPRREVESKEDATFR